MFNNPFKEINKEKGNNFTDLSYTAIVGLI